ncbi:uracil-DNA glycosylase family protein [Bradyrhizobium sp. sBnM-33]|uniref:uracil-DNA glycosylase family protein n=1 Tax=Bradyrhizobium sp. sBnM-33 TaxID=2831780 RepID=UPI00390CB302
MSAGSRPRVSSGNRGEAPGAEEAEQGRPFVGPAGCALRKLLEQAGIDLRQLRLANAIPFRPIEHTEKSTLRNRAPTIEEINHYGAAVLTDIRRSKPRVVVALGSTAARLFSASRSLRASRKAKLQFDGRPANHFSPGLRPPLRWGERRRLA